MHWRAARRGRRRGRARRHRHGRARRHRHGLSGTSNGPGYPGAFQVRVALPCIIIIFAQSPRPAAGLE